MKRYFFLIPFLIITQFTWGQNTSMITVFKHHSQFCNMIGTNEETYVVQLFSDSTIRFIKYSTGYKDNYNSVVKEVNTGTYSLKNDTLTAKYYNRVRRTQYKDKKANSLDAQTKVFNAATFYAPTQFTIYDALAVPVFGLIPTLEEIEVADYGLDYQFEHLTSSLKVFGVED